MTDLQGDTKFRNRNPSGVCEHCSTWVPTLHRDHIIPAFEGGLNDTSNLQWLCPKCDREKTIADLKRRKHTKVHVEKNRVARLGNKHLLGYRFSEESKRKISATLLTRRARGVREN